jgi:chemotaxis family two-component system sensor kinase Cph1
MSNAADTMLPWAGGPYSIKRHGTSLTVCETEPVQAPGCIQAHGVLLTVRRADLTILQVSENSADFLGKAPEQLLGKPLRSLLDVRQESRLLEMLATDSIERNALFAFTLAANGSVPPLDVSVHTTNGVVVLECEATGRSVSHLVHSDGDFFALVRAAVSRMQNITGLLNYCNRIAHEVRAITGLDRVMVYRFHADMHGEVVAESKLDELAPWLGLHYPEADIPKQARDLYKRIWIRPVPNAAGPLVEMVPLADPDSGQPLDMTHCTLRGASVMYTEYLANMNVAASLTMPILIDGELWGLIACHNQSPTTFPHQVRGACELLAQVASLQLKSSDSIEQMAYRLKVEEIHQKLVMKAAREGDLLALSDRQPSLRDAMDVEGAALYHMNRWWCAGKTPDETQLDALSDWINQRPEFDSLTRPAYVTDQLSLAYPPAAQFVDVASGLLAVQISRTRQDLIMWFRTETIRKVNWAGNPDDKPLVPGPHGMRLTPRRSFEVFVESVRARSRPWSELEVDCALRLRLLIMDLVIVSGERIADLNVDLTSSNEELDAFAYVASHDLKEPLRGIHRYAHQLMESMEGWGSDHRQRLESLMRLTLRMDSLLDSLLHYSRVGRTSLEFAPADLNEVVNEALEMVGVRPNKKTCQVVFARPLPTVLCDMIRVREVFSNLISNALKYTEKKVPRLEIGFISADDINNRPKAPATADGHSIYFVRDDGIGIAERHFEQIFRMFKRLHGSDEFGGGVGAGLTVVKKVVSRHGGDIWLDSVPHSGSTFYFTLPCFTGNGLKKGRIAL